MSEDPEEEGAGITGARHFKTPEQQQVDLLTTQVNEMRAVLITHGLIAPTKPDVAYLREEIGLPDAVIEMVVRTYDRQKSAYDEARRRWWS